MVVQAEAGALLLGALQPPGDSVMNAIPGVLRRDDWFPAMRTCTPLATPFQEKRKSVLWAAHDLSPAGGQVQSFLL